MYYTFNIASIELPPDIYLYLIGILAIETTPQSWLWHKEQEYIHQRNVF